MGSILLLIAIGCHPNYIPIPDGDIVPTAVMSDEVPQDLSSSLAAMPGALIHVEIVTIGEQDTPAHDLSPVRGTALWNGEQAMDMATEPQMLRNHHERSQER